MKKSIAIIGGGPAGLMAAETLSLNGLKIDLYDAMPSFGRKFLMAGKSGLNLTHSESFSAFICRFAERKKEIASFLEYFKPNDVVTWAENLGIETFVGSSGRIFPKEMKASPLLRAWLQRLQNNGVDFHLRHNWKGWDDNSLIFSTPQGSLKIKPDATILALGGASWPKLGSRGDWIPYLEKKGVNVKPFRPANCGFTINWSQHFIEKFHGSPIKTVILSFKDFKKAGEFVITKTGIEGSLIYSVSAKIRDEIEKHHFTTLELDLAPHSSKEELISALSRSRRSRSMSEHIKKTIGLHGAKLGLLYEFLPKEDFIDSEKLASAIKALPLPLTGMNTLERAISSAGGVPFEELDENLMLNKIPSVFCAGEMLDWEAPTGGYLLNACFALGKAAGEGAKKWLKI